MKKGIIQIILFVVFILAALYGLMWVISSSHLAHDYCVGRFELFHEEFRCRQPQIALILFFVSSLFGSVLLYLGIKNIKMHRANT